MLLISSFVGRRRGKMRRRWRGGGGTRRCVLVMSFIGRGVSEWRIRSQDFLLVEAVVATLTLGT